MKKTQNDKFSLIRSRRSIEIFNLFVIGVVGAVVIAYLNLLVGDEIRKEYIHGVLLIKVFNIGYLIVFTIFLMIGVGFFEKKPNDDC